MADSLDESPLDPSEPPPIGWRRKPLGSVAQISGGTTPSRSEERYWGDGVPWVTPSDLTARNGSGFFIDAGSEEITDLAVKETSVRILPPGSVLMTSRATIGEVAINNVHMATNQGFCNFEPRESIHRVFLAHWISGAKARFERLSSGSTFLELSKKDARRIPIDLPPLPEQRKIAAILSSMDDAIAATRKVIEQTERVKQGLLQTLMTRGIGHTRFKQTEIGDIPEGWEVVLLEGVARRGSGHTPSKSHPEYWDGGIKWVSLADSHRLDRVYITETEHSISEAGIANSSAVVHPAGTVLVSRDASVGKSAIATRELAVSQHFIAWQTGERLNNHYLYYWLQHHKPHFERMAVGNTVKTIGLAYFKALTIALPPRAEQERIAESLLSLERVVWTGERDMEQLQRLKRGLLQDLLTGRVRVTPD